MPELVRYTCRNCGHQFEKERYSRDESLEMERDGIQFGPLRCPECYRTDVREDWD